MFSGKRLQYIRMLRQMSQKELGMKLGFEENSAEIRISQYEREHRVPKEGLLETMADELGVIPETLKVPDIYDSVGIIHTFFALEDLYGFEVKNKNGKVYISLSDRIHDEYTWLKKGLIEWSIQAEKLRKGKISYVEYDKWRYHYKSTGKDYAGNPVSGYCRFCGDKIVGAGVFCSKCGRKI